jgi:hypothetical protein
LKITKQGSSGHLFWKQAKFLLLQIPQITEQMSNPDCHNIYRSHPLFLAEAFMQDGNAFFSIFKLKIKALPAS